MKYISAAHLREPLVVWVITVITFTVDLELHFRQPTCESDWLQVVASTTVVSEIHFRQPTSESHWLYGLQIMLWSVKYILDNLPVKATGGLGSRE